MLRTKQLGTLSHCARSFVLSNSRPSSGDGASCTCSQDEKCVSKRQSTGNKLHAQEKQSSLPAELAAPAATPTFRNSSGSVHHPASRNHNYVTSAAQVPSPASSLGSDLSSVSGKAKSIENSGHASLEGPIHSSKLSVESFIRPGMATVAKFSDLVNQSIPTVDGNGAHSTTTSVVKTHRSLNTRSSKGNPRNRASYSETSPKSSASSGKVSNSDSDTNEIPAVKAVKTSQVKVKKSSHTSEMVYKSALGAQSQKLSVPQRASCHSDADAEPGSKDFRVKSATLLPDKTRSMGKLQDPMKSMGSSAEGFAKTSQAISNGWRVEQFYHTLQQLKWGPNVEVILDNLHSMLNVFQANQVLKLLRDPSVALGFFNWLKRQPGFKHDEHTYTTMIGILGQAREFGAMRTLLKEMIVDGCQPTVVTYNRLIHTYGRGNYIADAINVFHHMQEAGCEPDRVTYCTLIDIHAKAGYLDIALDLYQRMQEVGLSPDTFTYSAMVNCLGKGGHLAAADKLFDEMIERGCVPSLVTYNIMIALQSKARNYSTVVKLYRNMLAAGFRPDKITYNIVMEVLGHCGRLDEAEAVFSEMQQDWIPDEPVYGLLVDLWGKSGNVDRARAWYQSMLDAGLRPNNMLGLGLVPSLQTYTLLLSCCTETRSEMGFCCHLMAITGHPAHAFLMSLPDSEPGGQNVRHHANSFLDLMHSEDRESKRGLVDAVIDFLYKSGLKEEAGSVWEVAAQRNLYPDSVKKKSPSYWLINLQVMSEGTALTALSRTLAWFRRQLLDSGVSPCRIDIITGWGRRSRVTGSSLVRQSVKELLHLFEFPFVTGNNNSGCFVGCGEPLNRWLLNSYVERMHLL
ncbi:putative Smr domain, tetratricopeptide-like helical domain superfamily [Dioscorea sansibarensis]